MIAAVLDEAEKQIEETLNQREEPFADDELKEIVLSEMRL